MASRFFWAITAILAFFCAPAFSAQAPDQKTEAPPAISAELLTQILDQEQLWLEAVQKTPMIVVFKPADQLKADSRREKWSLHVLALQEKAHSNRAWKSYWEKQRDILEKLLPLYALAMDQAGDDTLAAEKERISNIRDGLARWLDLCNKKMINQDVYLNAIDIEKDAYDSRLELMLPGKAGATGESGNEDTKIQMIRADDDKPTAYQKHENKLHELQRQRDMQLSKQQEALNDADLMLKLLDAGKVLLQAQQADLDLADFERSIADGQFKATAKDKQWNRNWKTVLAKVDEKLITLKQVMENQESQISRLTSEKNYNQAVVQIKGERAKDLEGQIEAHKKKTYKALLLTARDIALRKGLIVIAYLLAALICMRLIKSAGRMAINRASDDDPDTKSDQEQRAETLVSVFSSVGRGAIYIIFALLLLDTLGVNIGPLMGAFAIFGLAVSFGSQNLVKDFVNGFFILLEHQLSVGDVVEVAGESGTVERISLRRIMIRDAKGVSYTIPNSQVTKVANMTHGWARAIVNVGVSYNDDLRKVKDVYNDVGRKMYEDPSWNCHLLEAPIFLGVTELGDSAVVVRVWGKVVPQSQWSVERELNLRLKEASDANGIEIPFPQRVVELKK